MRNLFSSIILLFSVGTYSQEQEVKLVVDNFFVAFHQKDTFKLQKICSDKMILQSITEGQTGNKLSDETNKEFYHSIVTIPNDMKFQEKLLSYSVQIDGTMAHVWTPYEFYINGKLSHTGVNAFTLFKENEQWKIIYIIDTRRK
jgi:hypothetical protein